MLLLYAMGGAAKKGMDEWWPGGWVEARRPEWVSLVEGEAGVDNHGDPEGGEEEEEGPVPALAVVANDSPAGVLAVVGEGGCGGGGVAAEDGAEGPSPQCHWPELGGFWGGCRWWWRRWWW